MNRRKIVLEVTVITDENSDVILSRIDSTVLRELKDVEVTKVETFIYPV